MAQNYTRTPVFIIAASVLFLLVSPAMSAPITSLDVNGAQLGKADSDSDTASASIAKALIMLDRAGFSVGVIDGFDEENFRKGITSFDGEGYFSFEVSPAFIADGNVAVSVADMKDPFFVPISQTKGTATHGVISDIDDTLLETGAWNVARNLWTTFTTASTDRVVFEDTISLIRSRVSEYGPLFYVSSSPWNLHQYLLEIFKRTNAPIGPIFLRDLGIDKTKFVKSSHGSHKGDAIDLILAANPNLTFTLIGDTGQHDGEVYLDAATRHPGRITEICLRAAGQIDKKDTQIATSIRSTGAKFFSGPTFEPLT